MELRHELGPGYLISDGSSGGKVVFELVGGGIAEVSASVTQPGAGTIPPEGTPCIFWRDSNGEPYVVLYSKGEPFSHEAWREFLLSGPEHPPVIPVHWLPPALPPEGTLVTFGTDLYGNATIDEDPNGQPFSNAAWREFVAKVEHHKIGESFRG